MKINTLAWMSLAFVTGCDAWLTKPGLYNDVHVIVARRNGDPIPGVHLQLYTGQRPMGYGTTGSDGRYTFVQVPQGLYGVFASVPAGYDVIEDLIGAPPSIFVDRLQVADDTLSPVHFTFLKRGPGTVVVRVAQPDGVPLSGVPLTLYDPLKVDGKATTDETGRATFDAVPFGVYGVLATRPYLYRDYRTPGDSLFAVRDNLIIEDGSRDSVAFAFKKCVGTMSALAQDQAGAPVARATVAFYTSTDGLGVGVTGADGRYTYAPTPCAVQLGATINPPAGYTVPAGRGSSFFDGLTVTDGATVNVTFRLTRTP